ncbi:Glycosyltransferase, GT2 family [Cognatiyoonia koreensis]|uniref:Glycosyltransferase, GT2 family n=1 Tax=Cognatiyoonia koreensis TaxID=364200 RepID=A0A1I0RSW3_9RHOB|nr:glycosyltransferase [Cognatiyoonia koreensis]SEW44465.1 Glycosyltransferase, GT2 family [Cognatiyoonia koreensis]
MTNAIEHAIGVVIIGRNEGARLVRCLASVTGFAGRVIYVDSGSTDGSVAEAAAAGAEVVVLDMSRPFTAARARNAGLAALGVHEGLGTASDDAPEYIQFIDGDCEMDANWLEQGLNFLDSRHDVAVVSGRLRERHPDASIYNALCDEEWDAPVGETHYCGGIALMRKRALTQTGLFDSRMIAGEEPELCLRLQDDGWKIWRLPDEMALHDAAMMRFDQFWARMRRGGFAYALWTDMHGRGRNGLGARMMLRSLFWGAVLPISVLLAAVIVSPWAFALLLIYPLHMLQLVRRGHRPGTAMLLVVGKFAEAKGVVDFYLSKWRGKPVGLIEHK